ncbi:hypothetical protein BVG79_01101 [Ketogulonicigenium robustum]|uniref:Uncharacterized protein n=1 Tax=Ketogulonicigenium robustum TaxID=92947 RepID=A0A1W6NZK2_9RHOB|nr:hypothetical protein [Ketogulonicigenium robustum]ARO14447.1 hypothetical protein BVG79_01101 [Ketogulonicigenium robustum]
MSDPSPLRSPEFWGGVAVALIVKVRTSKQLGPWQVITTIVVAVLAAWVATEWVSALTGVPQPVAAAIVTLTAEGVMRWVLIAVNDPKQAIELWKAWRK